MSCPEPVGGTIVALVMLGFFAFGLLLGLRVGFKLWRVTYLEARRSWPEGPH